MNIEYLENIDDYKDLVTQFQYDIHKINIIIEFMEVKLGDYIYSKKKTYDEREINKEILKNMSRDERIEIFKCEMVNCECFSGYIAEMIVVHIYTLIDEYLHRVCLLFESQCNIDKNVKECKCVLKAYKYILDKNDIKNANENYFEDVDSIRNIRNAVVHNTNKLRRVPNENISKYCYITNDEYICISIDNLKDVLKLFKEYISSIFDEINLLVKE